MGLLYRFASRWVAGESRAPALDRVAERNRHGIGAIANVLGEHYRKAEEIEAAVAEYLDLLGDIRARKLDACVSVKLSQIGLAISYDRARENARRLADAFRREGVFLWFDMESSAFTEDTLRLYRDVLDRWPRSGVCLQANLRRTRKDLEGLLDRGGHVRLVKGAYREEEPVGYRGRVEIDRSMRELVDLLFERGKGFAVASHDSAVIEHALERSREHPTDFEFQMLLGVREPLKRDLAARGHRVLDYVPYGPNWLPYFTRRLQERPRNVFTMLRSLVGG